MLLQAVTGKAFTGGVVTGSGGRGSRMDAHDDPKVKGVTCYVSRAKTGGIKGAVGLAEDKSEASIACRQVGPISFAKPLALQE